MHTHTTLMHNRRRRRASSGELSGGDCHDEEGVLWGVLPCGPDGGLCLHCTATCTGTGVCSLWRPPLILEVLEDKGKALQLNCIYMYKLETRVCHAIYISIPQFRFESCFLCIID